MRNISVSSDAELYSAADHDAVRQLQARLTELGCYSGPVNGIADRSTKDAAVSCRAFAEGKLPLVLNEATVATFNDVYIGAEVSGLPPGTLPVRPPFTIRIGETHADKFGDGGPESQAASQFEGQVAYPDGSREALSFMLIGDYNLKQQNFDRLDILLDDTIGKTVPPKLQSCGHIRFEDRDDGKRAVIQLSQMGEGRQVALTSPCIIDALPPKLGAEAKFLLSHFREVAQSMESIDAIKLISHDGLKVFMQRVADGELQVKAF